MSSGRVDLVDWAVSDPEFRQKNAEKKSASKAKEADKKKKEESPVANGVEEVHAVLDKDAMDGDDNAPGAD